MLPIVGFIANVMPDYLWYSIPLGLWILFLITIGGVWLISRKENNLHWLFLTPTNVEQGTYTISIPFDETDIKGKMLLLQEYILSQNLDKSLLTNVQHCIEEQVYHELDMGKATGRTGAFDISVQYQPARLTIIIKDVGKAYNPQIIYQEKSNEDIDENMLFMNITQHFCKDINYQYQNGQNCLYLNFPIDRK